MKVLPLLSTVHHFVVPGLSRMALVYEDCRRGVLRDAEVAPMLLRVKVKSPWRENGRDAFQEAETHLNEQKPSWEGGVQGGGGWISVPE